MDKRVNHCTQKHIMYLYNLMVFTLAYFSIKPQIYLNSKTNLLFDANTNTDPTARPKKYVAQAIN